MRAAVDFALARKRLSLEAFRALVIRSKGRRGVRLLLMLRAFEGGDGPTESELEARVMELIDAEGLPRPRRQPSLRLSQGDGDGSTSCFPGRTSSSEADGFAWHANPISFEKDRERANALAARGFVVLHWTWQALCDGEPR